ncbi:Protein tesmin/TSO1-like CXC 5 [Camellia lanceoleosa]|uniref:Protein tesmin/TSO1-like CXC 5 n=1 Tax=Camellia lanceoleosa TaxID=1840588 RepID=A0ACC0HDC5_9ERIC|nr:Protein tesmin/TSO1-like CXC 5 [Camellia lanceoleosa]
MDKQLERDQLEDSVVSSAQQGKIEGLVQTAIPDDRLSGNQADIADDSILDGSDAQTRRSLSPATIALMCDEQDAMFMAVGSPDAAASCSGNTTLKSSHRQGFITELYAEQERMVLMKFWKFLNRLITCGSIKGESLFCYAFLVFCFVILNFNLLLLCNTKRHLGFIYG